MGPNDVQHSTIHGTSPVQWKLSQLLEFTGRFWVPAWQLKLTVTCLRLIGQNPAALQSELTALGYLDKGKRR